jgi:hypothetical protein
MYLYDVRKCKSLGEKRKVTVTLNPYEPTVFAVSAEPFPELRVGAPKEIKRGSTAHINIDLAETPASLDIVHVDVMNPAGERVLYYSENVFAQSGHAAKQIPLAENDPAGTWTLQVHDLLSGQQKIIKMNVE